MYNHVALEIRDIVSEITWLCVTFLYTTYVRTVHAKDNRLDRINLLYFYLYMNMHLRWNISKNLYRWIP